MILFTDPVGTFGFNSPQHTSMESSQVRQNSSSLEREKGLSLIRVIAVPPPLLLGLGVEMYWIP